MKRCPYCAEKILDKAVVCRYCHRDLPPQQNGVSQSNAPALEIASSKVNNRKKGLMIAGGVLVGIIICCISLYFTAIASINRAVPGTILPNVPRIKLWNAGKIYFTEANKPNLYVMNADGTGLQEIPQNEVIYSDVSVSHDGRKIVFVDTTNESALYIMNADGSSLRKLISNCLCANPVFTPDGMQIIFEHLTSLNIINSDGTDQRELLSRLVDHSQPIDPDISPDGKEILFWGNNVNSNLFMANIDGTGITQLTFDDQGFWVYPVWSPDGKTFAAVKINYGSPSKGELYLFNRDGSGSKKLVTISSGRITWDPSGKWILFAEGKRLNLIDIASGKVYKYPKIKEIDHNNLQWTP